MDPVPLDGLRARLTPGAFLFALADAAQAAALREELAQVGLHWLGWGQRQALLQAWRPAAQERYSSMAGREAPTLFDWLSPQFRRWQLGPEGVSRLLDQPESVHAVISLCELEALASRPLSLFSNGEAARACLAAALAGDPTLLVLHDLAEGLDAQGRRLLLKVGKALSARGCAVLFLASRPSLLPTANVDQAHPLAKLAELGDLLFVCEALDLQAGERPLISALTWRVRGGEAWWLQGPNGQGKSTLLAYLSGEHPQAWARSWELLGQGRGAYTPLAALRREVAWVSPELAAVAKKPILQLLDAALASPARLLLVDEALRGLDEASLHGWKERLGAWMSQDRALVFVCHDPIEAPACLNQRLVLG